MYNYHIFLSSPLNSIRLVKLTPGQYLEPSTDAKQKLELSLHEKHSTFILKGVNQEILEMSRIPHYSVGGTIHLTVNNQVGFTTPGERGRSHRFVR